MVSVLLLVGLAASVFVGFNIGGSSTGIAFGPPVGAGLVRKTGAAGLMVVFVFLGGWTVGRNVIETLAGEQLPPEVAAEVQRQVTEEIADEIREEVRAEVGRQIAEERRRRIAELTRRSGEDDGQGTA